MASIYQKINLLKGLFTGTFAYTGPFHIMVDITRKCNLRCFGCRFHSSEAHRPSPGDQSVTEIPFEMFKNLCGRFPVILVGSTHGLRLTELLSPVAHVIYPWATLQQTVFARYGIAQLTGISGYTLWLKKGCLTMIGNVTANSAVMLKTMCVFIGCSDG